MSSTILPYRRGAAIAPEYLEPATQSVVKTLRADLFERQFPWPTSSAVKRTEYGNNGRVEYRAKQTLRAHQLVAVKLQPASARSAREQSLLQLSQSPHVITLRDSFEVSSENRPTELVFIMPAATPLQEAWQLWPTRPGEHAPAVALAQDLLSAVDFLHHLGIFHRDIKPSNILMHHQRAVLGDFGEAYQHPSAPYASLYRWADVRDSAALIAEALTVAQTPHSAGQLTSWLHRQNRTLTTDAVRQAFQDALMPTPDGALQMPKASAARAYQFWRFVQLAEKEIDSVRKKGVVMTVRQSMPQWSAEAYDKQTRPWAYAGARQA